MEKEDFINAYKKKFINNDELKLKFEMGGDMDGDKRLNQVIQRFKEISNYVFKDNEVWVLLIIWDANGKNKQELINSGFDISLASSYYDGALDDGLIKKQNFYEEAFQDAEILYLKYKHYSFDDIIPLVYSKAGFELGLENTAGIVAYFVSFENQPVLLNLYDDRGMELLSHGRETINKISVEFSEYIR